MAFLENSLSADATSRRVAASRSVRRRSRPLGYLDVRNFTRGSPPFVLYAFRPIRKRTKSGVPVSLLAAPIIESSAFGAWLLTGARPVSFRSFVRRAVPRRTAPPRADSH